MKKKDRRGWDLNQHHRTYGELVGAGLAEDDVVAGLGDAVLCEVVDVPLSDHVTSRVHVRSENLQKKLSFNLLSFGRAFPKKV